MRPHALLLGLATAFAIRALASPGDTEIEQPASVHRIKPTQDPFYKAPAGFEHQHPGAILRHRTIPNAPATFGDAVFGSAYQLLYRTTSSTGNAQVAVTTVFVPAKNANPKKLLSYQIPYDAAYINCDPSYALRTGSRKAFLGNEDLLLIASSLAQGWFVSTADYEASIPYNGPRAAYTSGIQAGQATLDGVRAVLASHAITGISADKDSIDYSLWGYSGGALASEWALELQHTYAPELHFVGAALGGLTPNITSVFHTINKGIFAGLAAAGIVGLTRGYSNLSSFVHEHLKPATKDEFLQAGKQCYLKDIKEFIGKDITKYFDIGDKILTDPIPASVVQATGIMGLHGVPKAPLYVYKAIKDEISVIADTTALVHKFCGKGADISYDKNSAGAHVSEGGLGAPAALRFLVARMNGEKFHHGCKIATVNTSNKLSAKDEKILTPTVYKALQKLLVGERGLRR